MKLSKNIFAFALCFAMFSPIISHDECIEEQESTQTKLNQAQETIIEEIGSELIECAISAIANAINTAHTTANSTPISQQAAVALLQDFINNLGAGNNFTLNGVNYTVEQANKNSEVSE